MTNQTTDEAAVEPNVLILSSICGYHHRADCESCKNSRECSDAEIRRLYMLAKANNLLARRHADEIENLRAQLTAATRRAEQAERMLAEAVSTIEYVSFALPVMRTMFDKLDMFGGIAQVDGMQRAVDAAIRSAASGEQG